MFENLLGFLLEAAIFIVILAALWLGLRFIFRFTMRMFSIGCAIIIMLGICFILFRMFLFN